MDCAVIVDSVDEISPYRENFNADFFFLVKKCVCALNLNYSKLIYTGQQ